MNGRLRAKQPITYWFILLLVVLVQIVIAWRAVVADHHFHLAEIESNAEKNIQFLNHVLREKLQNREYAATDTFLRQWSVSHSPQVVEISLTTANG
ncbi:MAG: hypothetical protein JXO49_07555, partial [Deltaproteobacteria bacterium]|nr:hypothetical protein [Candidatus Anaeroferrophillus wilburensis]MBN2889183.1 hypothetical protein [Deltaproteobacteria bacterium]